nr:MAG TPA: hypothetical protein [Caudoviricetes sp.]
MSVITRYIAKITIQEQCTLMRTATLLLLMNLSELMSK